MNKLNIGCEEDYKEGWLNIDFERSKITKPDKIVDLNKLPLPFKKNTFDVINCTEVLEHILYPESVLKELRRILKDEGRLIISMPNISNILERFRFFFKGVIDTFDMEMPHHFHFTNMKQQRALYEKYFVIYSCEYNSIEGKKYNKLPLFLQLWIMKVFPVLFVLNMVCELRK